MQIQHVNLSIPDLKTLIFIPPLDSSIISSQAFSLLLS